MIRFSRPVRVWSTAACWPASPITRRTATGRRTTSIPATVTRPASGLSSVARIRTRVVLPAPFAPSSADTFPSATCMLSPSSAVVLPNDLRTPAMSMIGSAASTSSSSAK
jgi:hypothetical protein